MTLIKQELLDYIRTEILYDRVDALAPDVLLLDGALESVDVLRLVVFVEERYSITIDDDDLVPENFRTVTTLADFVHAKKGEAAG